MAQAAWYHKPEPIIPGFREQLDKQQRSGVVWDQREIFWRLIRE
jgi:hypothetical protein